MCNVNYVVILFLHSDKKYRLLASGDLSLGSLHNGVGIRLLVFGCSVYLQECGLWNGRTGTMVRRATLDRGNNEDDTERPQCTYHPVSNVLETV